MLLPDDGASRTSQITANFFEGRCFARIDSCRKIPPLNQSEAASWNIVDGSLSEHDIGYASASTSMTNKVKPVEVGALQINVGFSAFQSFYFISTPSRSSPSFHHHATS